MYMLHFLTYADMYIYACNDLSCTGRGHGESEQTGGCPAIR